MMQAINRLILAGVAAFALPAAAGLSSAAAAGPQASARSSGSSYYQEQRAACDSLQSAESRRACQREAGAAAEEAKRNRLSNNMSEKDFERNALARCGALPPGDRDACERRVKGEGRVSGSVAGGGIYRELVVPDTGSGASMPSDTTNSGGATTGSGMR